MILSPVITTAQQKVSIRTSGYTAEKQAEGQTSWLTKKLRLDKTTSDVVYKINLKYLLQTDSLRMTTTETVNKNSLHGEILQKRNAELQSVLSSEQYSKYISVFGNGERSPK